MNENWLDDLDAELGELLRLHRLSAGKSEKDVAAAANMTKAKVSACELGKQPLSVNCLCRLAGALGLSAAELLGQVEQRLDGRRMRQAEDGRGALDFMASNRGRQLVRAWSQCDDARLLDAFTNLFLAASMKKKTEKAAAQRHARVGN